MLFRWTLHVYLKCGSLSMGLKNSTKMGIFDRISLLLNSASKVYRELFELPTDSATESETNSISISIPYYDPKHQSQHLRLGLKLRVMVNHKAKKV